MAEQGWHNEKGAKRELRIVELYELGYDPEEIGGMVGLTKQSVRMRLSQMGIYDKQLTKDYLKAIWPMWTAACNNLK